MRESLRSYVRAVLFGWAGLVGVATGVLAVVFGVVPNLRVGLWIWIGVTAALFIVAGFLAFHEEREKGPEIAGALSLTGMGFEIFDNQNAPSSVQLNLQFTNTWDKQIRYRIVAYLQTIEGVLESNDEYLLGREEWIGRGQDAGIRFPAVNSLPQQDLYKGTITYQIVYESPSIRHYEHRTGRTLSFFLTIDRLQNPPYRTTNYVFVGAYDEETKRLSRKQVAHKEAHRSLST